MAMISKYITTKQFAFLTSASIFNLFGLAMLAQQELVVFSYVIYATLFFLIPAALVSAQLGSAFAHEEGGVYVWVKKTLSPFWGMLAIFFQWVQSLALYPVLLGFGAVACFYMIGKPELSDNGFWIFLFSVIIFWLASFVNLKGRRWLTKLSNWTFVGGMLGSVIILITMALIWIFSGKPIGLLHLPSTASNVVTIEQGVVRPRFLPELNNLSDIVFLAGIILLFAGVEAQATHVLQMKDPKKQFPRALILASALTFGMFLLGGLAVAVIVPYQEITLDSGIFNAFKIFATEFNLPWLVNVLSGLIVFAMFGEVLPWIGGPSRGLQVAAQEGQLPRFLTYINKKGIQSHVILLQGVVVTFLCGIYLVFKNPNVGFFFMTTFTVGLYLIMYLLMYLASMVLPYRLPNLMQPFKIPGGKIGNFIVAGLGFLGAAFAFIVSFFPPNQLVIGKPVLYTSLAIGGVVTFAILAIILNYYSKKAYRQSKVKLSNLKPKRLL